MIYKLHYWFIASGANALGILLGVFMECYTDASSTEIGMLYMMMPFIGIIFKPIICSRADRKHAHRSYMMSCQLVVAISYLPFIILPMLGPDFYDNHPRLCFYILVALKVIGDAAFGGLVSIGDSLAINYAKRLNVDFSVYRIWGTISWMVFGCVIGQINEVWFLPKYVPGFMVLVSSSLLGMFCVYLWPKEYFEMVAHSSLSNESSNEKGQQTDHLKAIEGGQKTKVKKESAITKSLMPREVVWAHAKKQMLALVTLRCCTNTDKDSTNDGHPDKSNSVEVLKESGIAQDNKTKDSHQSEEVTMKTQLQILWLLVKRDPRIVGYLLAFVGAGFSIVPLSFFFISLAQICHADNRCDFSQLGGFLQVSMAMAETVLLWYIKRMMAKIGRLNTLTIAFSLVAMKYAFYGTIWRDVDPHWSLVAESVHGVTFGIFLTAMVEMGHLFANEVELVIPELMQKNIIEKKFNVEKLKLSLQATMQAIISNANDGLGRGFGALIYGLILDHYDYITLWRCIAVGATMVILIIETINIVQFVFGLKFGPEAGHLEELKKPAKLEDGLSRIPREKLTHKLSNGRSAVQTL